MGTRSIREALKALQVVFSAAKIPPSLPTATRQLLEEIVEEYGQGVDEDQRLSVHDNLKNFWEQFVEDSPAKYGPFVGVLRELRPLFDEVDILEWWQLVVKPVISGTGHGKAALEDAQELLVACMVYDDDADDEDDHLRAQTSNRLLGDLWSLYVARTGALRDEDRYVALENAQVAHQLESVLTAFGRRQPMELFHTLDRLITVASTRLQALTLLSTFIRSQTTQLYMVSTTSLVEHLLQCLMEDTSTTILSVALTSLVMLLPHFPGELGPHLPRLFLVYSRLLCWDRATSPRAGSSVYNSTHGNLQSNHGRAGMTPPWDMAAPLDIMSETEPPELMTYFTSLYGLFPLNLMSYVRKPGKYLKECGYPGTEDCDLDRAAIRRRTEKFTQAHMCHSNFYRMTIEEELNDPKWLKAEPADVVASCQSLLVNTKPAYVSPGPPPTSRLPEVPPLRSLISGSRSGQVSPSASHASFRSGHSSKGNPQASALPGIGESGDSPILRPHDLQYDENPMLGILSRPNNISRTPSSGDDGAVSGRANGLRVTKDKEDVPQTNVAYFQRENTLLRNELNYERWQKLQHSQSGGQPTQKTAKEAMPDANTTNLILGNQVLKVQLEQMRNTRDAAIAESVLLRQQVDDGGADLSGRFGTTKKEQETWRADADELRKLRKDVAKYNKLLNTAEARELSKSHALELAKRDLEQMQDDSAELRKVQQRLYESQSRERDSDQVKREQETLLREKQTLLTRIERNQLDHERTCRTYTDKIAELEAQVAAGDTFDRQSARHHNSPDMQNVLQQAISDSQSKVAQLRKKYHALMSKHSDLELEYESVKDQLDALQMHSGGYKSQPYTREADRDGLGIMPYDRAPSRATTLMSGGLGRSHDASFEMSSDSASGSEPAYTMKSGSDAPNRRFLPPPVRNLPLSPPSSDGGMHGNNANHVNWRPPVRQDSQASAASTIPATTYNQTAPLSQVETVGSGVSILSAGSEERRKEKIKVDSKVRVYGRGGAQNIKLKTKEEAKAEEAKQQKKSKGGLRGLIG